MKKLFFTLLTIFLLLFSSLENTFSSYYRTDDGKQISIQTKKTALLLKKHVDKLEKQIKFYQNKLELYNDKKIKEWLKDIEKINRGLEAIKNDKIDALKANILVKSIINRLKSINKQLKPYLKEKLLENQKKVKKLKEKYIPIIKNFSKKLQSGIEKIRKKIKEKKYISQKEKNILFYLDNIENYTLRLNTFSRKNFYSTKELKNFLIVNIKGIINNINSIKQELN